MGNGQGDVLTRKKARLDCSGSNAGSSFSSQEIWMFESTMQNLEKALARSLITRGGLTSFGSSRVTWSSMHQNETIPESSGKLLGIPNSLWQVERDPKSPRHLDRIPYYVSLPKENPEVSLATRQES